MKTFLFFLVVIFSGLSLKAEFTWVKTNFLSDSLNVYNISVSPNNFIYTSIENVITGRSYIMKSKDNGNTWTALNYSKSIYVNSCYFF